jgi:hypothetical protein
MSSCQTQKQAQERINHRAAVRDSLPLYCYPPKSTRVTASEGFEMALGFIVIIGAPCLFAVATLIWGV